MKPLSEIANVFSDLDMLPEERRRHFDKALRNLSQRHFFPPDAQEGKAFLYDRDSVAVLRLVQIAAGFGLDRVMLDGINFWLRAAGTKRVRVTGGYQGVTRIREMLERARDGEDFNLHIIMDSTGKVYHSLDWSTEATSERASRTLDLISAPELARVTLPASTLLRQLPASEG
ncbi:hypothetical protein QBK99_07835 [Corticibacterium sp. UT-5YL-CI-8]|nr:hypothetical protein [Tianweitania sp. UT-5YL-CI-8]